MASASATTWMRSPVELAHDARPVTNSKSVRGGAFSPASDRARLALSADSARSPPDTRPRRLHRRIPPRATRADNLNPHDGGQVQRGFSIILGLAEGIDITDHEATTPTGGAADRGDRNRHHAGQNYPVQHRALHERVDAASALVSQFPPDPSATKQSVPMRNATISGRGSVRATSTFRHRLLGTRL